MKSTVLIPVIMGILSLGNASANQDSNSDLLLERIQTLEERLTVLESRFSFSSFMPDFAERFHVMHRASESDDWAVASHELQEMKRLIELSITIDADKGHLLQAMMGPVMAKMDSAIGHANGKKMVTLLSEAVQTCNSCHVATGSPFIKVTLDAAGALSMRHPHAFTRQKMKRDHKH
ncbi:MAG: hypothetical protein O7D36_04805 [Gammaproteobacteria bacterium]|nr:hypothetical protein [Gammaproteobacteria bacterium]MCZ6797251.1 hypothetical protein [Gammaproteobacteria bacterium]